LFVAAVLTGCEYHPHIRAGVIACEVDGPSCPPPYVCVPRSELETHGLCDLPPADASPKQPEDARVTARNDAGPGDLSPAGGEVLPDAAPLADVPPADLAPPDLAPPDVPAPPPPDAAPDTAPDTSYVCPRGRGPDMVNVGSAVPFCIDTTEVTNLQYKAFLDDPKIDLSLEPEVCRTRNDGYAPTSSDGGGLNVTTRADHPVVNVDWCDAYAFCKWAGKRLCGTIGGGALAPGAATVPSVSQWAHACTRGGVNSYPYGLIFNKAACNIGRPEFPINTVPVGSKKGCVGGYVGMFDMVGNVEEWVDFCRMDPAEGWVCGVIGSPYTASDAEATCQGFYDDPMIDHWVARGFRCCAP
jgi:formylglycine-generating enzyme required for sulfatase activity